MIYHVTFEAFESIIGDNVPALRKNAGEWLSKTLETGKVKEHGIFVGKRGGFIVIDAESNEELFGLITNMVDRFKITVNPIVGVATLGEFFRDHPHS